MSPANPRWPARRITRCCDGPFRRRQPVGGPSCFTALAPAPPPAPLNRCAAHPRASPAPPDPHPPTPHPIRGIGVDLHPVRSSAPAGETSKNHRRGQHVHPPGQRQRALPRPQRLRRQFSVTSDDEHAVSTVPAGPPFRPYRTPARRSRSCPVPCHRLALNVIPRVHRQPRNVAYITPVTPRSAARSDQRMRSRPFDRLPRRFQAQPPAGPSPAPPARDPKKARVRTPRPASRTPPHLISLPSPNRFQPRSAGNSHYPFPHLESAVPQPFLGTHPPFKTSGHPHDHHLITGHPGCRWAGDPDSRIRPAVPPHVAGRTTGGSVVEHEGAAGAVGYVAQPVGRLDDRQRVEAELEEFLSGVDGGGGVAGLAPRPSRLRPSSRAGPARALPARRAA